MKQQANTQTLAVQPTSQILAAPNTTPAGSQPRKPLQTLLSNQTEQQAKRPQQQKSAATQPRKPPIDDKQLFAQSIKRYHPAPQLNLNSTTNRAAPHYQQPISHHAHEDELDSTSTFTHVDRVQTSSGLPPETPHSFKVAFWRTTRDQPGRPRHGHNQHLHEGYADYPEHPFNQSSSNQVPAGLTDTVPYNFINTAHLFGSSRTHSQSGNHTIVARRSSVRPPELYFRSTPKECIQEDPSGPIKQSQQVDHQTETHISTETTHKQAEVPKQNSTAKTSKRTEHEKEDKDKTEPLGEVHTEDPIPQFPYYRTSVLTNTVMMYDSKHPVTTTDQDVQTAPEKRDKSIQLTPPPSPPTYVDDTQTAVNVHTRTTMRTRPIQTTPERVESGTSTNEENGHGVKSSKQIFEGTSLTLNFFWILE